MDNEHELLMREIALTKAIEAHKGYFNAPEIVIAAETYLAFLKAGLPSQTAPDA